MAILIEKVLGQGLICRQNKRISFSTKCEKPPFQPRLWFCLEPPYTCHFEQDEYECWSELFPLKGCLTCGQHSQCKHLQVCI